MSWWWGGSLGSTESVSGSHKSQIAKKPKTT